MQVRAGPIIRLRTGQTGVIGVVFPLGHEKKRVTGTIECGGMRSGDGSQKRACGLRASYSISVERAPDAVVPIR